MYKCYFRYLQQRYKMADVIDEQTTLSVLMFYFFIDSLSITYQKVLLTHNEELHKRSQCTSSVITRDFTNIHWLDRHNKPNAKTLKQTSPHDNIDIMSNHQKDERDNEECHAAYKGPFPAKFRGQRSSGKRSWKEIDHCWFQTRQLLSHWPPSIDCQVVNQCKSMHSLISQALRVCLSLDKYQKYFKDKMINTRFWLVLFPHFHHLWKITGSRWVLTDKLLTNRHGLT